MIALTAKEEMCCVFGGSCYCYCTRNTGLLGKEGERVYVGIKRNAEEYSDYCHPIYELYFYNSDCEEVPKGNIFASKLFM